VAFKRIFMITLAGAMEVSELSGKDLLADGARLRPRATLRS